MTAARVLLLEDSAIDAELVLGHLLRDDPSAYATRRAATRAEYVTALAQEPFDLILADFSLPDFDGLSALQMAREMAPQTPFLFVSGVVGEDFAINAMRQGATDYVLKRNLTRLPAAAARALGEAKMQKERAAALAALQEVRARLQAMFDHTQIGILEIDLETTAILRANPALYAMLGYRDGELIGRALGDFVHGGDPSCENLLQRADEAGDEGFVTECRCLGAGSQAMWAQLSLTVIRTGGAPYCLTTVTDITTRKRYEQQLQALNESLEAKVEERTRELARSHRHLIDEIAERKRAETTLRQMQRLEAVGQLTSGVAHDFNNLLTVILGNLAFLQKRLAVDADQKRRLDNMRDAALRGAKLVGQLLAFSRRQRLDPAPVELNDTVREMSDLLQSTLGGALRLELDLADALWPALVDATQIELIILNLALNARDASPVGGMLTVSTANASLQGAAAEEKQLAEGDYVVLSVEDTGTGMTDEVKAKAFEPFFTTKDVGKGSGLGLAQVYGFAKQSGGGVMIDSTFGKGTRVSVYLPRASAPAQAKARAEHVVAANGAPASRRVLVVDDDLAVRDVTSSILRELGCLVMEAESGPRALEILDADAEVDMVLIDFAMPIMNGRDLADAIAARRPGLPVLFITGYADLGALDGVGEERILTKPFTDHDLRDRMDRIASPR